MSDDTNQEITHLKSHLTQHPHDNTIPPRHLSIIIGPKGAGKTFFFKQSSLNHCQTVSPKYGDCNSWHNDKSSFLEIPESLLSHKKVNRRYVKTYAKTFGRSRVDSVVICVSILDSIKLPPRTLVEELQKLKQCLESIGKPLEGAKLFLCFTQMDKIAGFCHSFTDSELTTWGYSFFPYPNIASLIKQQDSKFESLLKQLHETIIERLHLTKDSLTRYLIREFPLQMESVGNMVRACVKQLSNPKTTTSAVFFTGAKQGNTAFDRLSANITQTYALNINPSIPQSTRNTAFFVDGCINTIIEHHNSEAQIQTRKQVFAAGITGLVLTASILGLHFRNSALLDEVSQELFFYQHRQTTNLSDLSQSLEHLGRANQLVSQTTALLPMTNLEKYKTQIGDTYDSGLQASFLPTIRTQLEQVLSQRLSPAESYYSLKTYLMLGGKLPLDRPYLSRWFNQFWEQNKALEPKSLNKLLLAAIKEPYQGIRLDKATIINTQSYLNALPEEYLYYNLILGNVPKDDKTLTLDFIHPVTVKIPYIYQKDNFLTVYNTLLPKFSRQFENDRVVLNRSGQFNPSTALQKMYLTKYFHWWEKLAEQPLPTSFQNYVDGTTLFNHLTNKHSPLMKLSGHIQENTVAFNPAKNAAESHFNHAVASHFTALNMFTDNQEQQLTPIFSDLAHYFKMLAVSDNTDETAFSIAKSRFSNHQIDPISQLLRTSEQLPFPLKHWISNIANDSWSIILQNAKDHINQQWQVMVYSDYQKHIQGRFPFDSNTNIEISEENFVDFFGYQGQLASFMQNYLLPFLDTDNPKWQTKTRNGLKLPVSEKTLTELMRINVIREMFFPKYAKRPTVNFELQTVALEPVIKSLTLNMNGQRLDTKQQSVSKSFTWPGKTQQAMSSLLVDNLSGKTYSFTENGFWAWFKLLGKSNIASVNNSTQSYQVIFDVNGHASKFLLTANDAVNPFIPGILNSFELPEEIA